MAEAAAPEQPKKKKKMVRTLVIVLGVAIVQGATFFAFMKFAGGGPRATSAVPSAEQAAAAAAEPEAAPEEPGSAEVALLQRFRVPNNKSGAVIIYDFDISVVVLAARKAQFEEALKNHSAEISDRVAQAVRAAPARVFSEDDLGTLRRLIKGMVCEVLGDDEVVQRVLIPRCVPLRTD